MIRSAWENLSPTVQLAIVGATAYIAYPAVYAAGLELWCIAYGFGMQLGLL